MANMPLYDLLGGKTREAAAVYVHASGDSNEEVGDKMEAFIEEGFHHIRVQVSTPGYSTYGNKSSNAGKETLENKNAKTGPIPITSRIEIQEKGKLYFAHECRLRKPLGSGTLAGGTLILWTWCVYLTLGFLSSVC